MSNQSKVTVNTMNGNVDPLATQGARRATGEANGLASPSLPIAPDVEVVAHAKRRQFSSAEKRRILTQAERCKPGELGAFLRREGVYSSSLSTWRRQREVGDLAALAAHRRGPKADPNRAEAQQIAKLIGENERLKDQLEKARLIIDVQKKSCCPDRPYAGRQRREDLMARANELAPMVGTGIACAALGLWRGAPARDRARVHRAALSGPACLRPARPRPPLALSALESQALLATLNSERFVDTAPAAVHAILLDEGRYLGSVRTMYRHLAASGGSCERRNQRVHPAYAKPELLASGSNQVWSWDITKLKGPAKWTCFHLYVILDIYSRYVVGWMIADRECSILAKQLIAGAVDLHDIAPGTLTLHADRGASMRSKTVAELLVDLTITKSHSRPHVSDDNPYSEAQFKTLKYRPEFPARFGCIEDARAYCRAFFCWYNGEHRHSGIGFMTPHNLHYGHAARIQINRQTVLDTAFHAHPERFKKIKPHPPALPTAAWINPPKKESVTNVTALPCTVNS